MTIDPYWTIDELSDRIRGELVSCAEVVDACLARIEFVNKQVNAFITVLPDADARVYGRSSVLMARRSSIAR